MFARAYLTDAYTNRIGLKGYHFIVTDEPYHNSLEKDQIKRIFGNDIFTAELAKMSRLPSVTRMVKELKSKTHQFILLLDGQYGDEHEMWSSLCGKESVIRISSTRQLPKIISAIIGLAEGTLDIAGIGEYLGKDRSSDLIAQLSKIDIGAQARLRHALPHPVPKAGDIFANKTDLWPIQPGEEKIEEEPAPDHINYL